MLCRTRTTPAGNRTPRPLTPSCPLGGAGAKVWLPLLKARGSMMMSAVPPPPQPCVQVDLRRESGRRRGCPGTPGCPPLVLPQSASVCAGTAMGTTSSRGARPGRRDGMRMMLPRLRRKLSGRRGLRMLTGSRQPLHTERAAAQRFPSTVRLRGGCLTLKYRGTAMLHS